MFCTSCGTKNAMDSNFCRQCGSKLNRPTAAKINADDFERSLPEDEQVSTLLERAYRLRKENDLDGAIALCHEALRLRVDGTSAHSLLGQLYEESGNHEAAVREYERVLQLNPGSIADRVKLDELRGDSSPVDERKPRARVVMADPQSASTGYARFTNVGIACALLALGALVALQFRPHASEPGGASTDPSLTSSKSSPVASLAGQTKEPSTSPIVPGENVRSAMPENARPITSVTGPGKLPTDASASASPLTSATLPGNFAPQSTIIYRPGPPRYIPMPVPTPQVATSPRPPAAKNSKSGAKQSDENPIVVLPGDSDVIENRDGKITVRVNGNDVSGKTGKKGTPRDDDNNPGNSVTLDKPKGGGHSTNSGAAGSSTGATSSTEARSFVAVGTELKRKQDFKGAIEAFTRALPTAGDQAGYVLQQRALCYQTLNDLTSAKTDYARAIEEYHKLEARDAETAHNGIRACERGIQACGN